MGSFELPLSLFTSSFFPKILKGFFYTYKKIQFKKQRVRVVAQKKL